MLTSLNVIILCPYCPYNITTTYESIRITCSVCLSSYLCETYREFKPHAPILQL